MQHLFDTRVPLYLGLRGVKYVAIAILPHEHVPTKGLNLTDGAVFNLDETFPKDILPGDLNKS